MIKQKFEIIYKFIDYSLIFFPIALILGAPAVNLYLATYSIIFLYLSINLNFLDWHKENWIKIIFIFWLYLIFISLFATDYVNALRSSFFFIRYLFFSLLIGYFGFKIIKFENILKIWFFILLVVVIDVWVQFTVGVDIFGIEKNGNRLSGPFGDELVLGAFIWKLSCPIISLIILKFFLNGDYVYKKYLIACSILPVTVLISGERMSFVMYLLFLIATTTYLSFYKKKLKLFLGLIIVSIFSLLIIFSNISSVKNRYQEFYNIVENFGSSSYGKLFVSGFELWKKNPVIGVGLKNFRIECDEQLENREPILHPLCSTHPHNLYLEILSETGIVGFLIFISFVTTFLVRYFNLNLFLKNNDKNFFFVVTLLISFISFIWPISTSGSFFTTWNGSFYWMIIGLIIFFTNQKKLTI